jgi:hypothetical protein
MEGDGAAITFRLMTNYTTRWRLREIIPSA